MDIIYNEDCFDTFKRIDNKSIDMILCDLPYGVTACKWDSVIPLEPLWKEYKRIIKDNGAIVLTASQPFTSRLVMSNPEMFKYEWIWEKPQPSNSLMAKKLPLKYHENILVFGGSNYYPILWAGKPNHPRNDSGQDMASELMGAKIKRTITNKSGIKYPKSIIQLPAIRSHKLHPTQKPVALFEYLIKTYTNESDLVLDNCIGSGTTAVACINLNRHYIGCELEKKYYDIAVKRIEEAKHRLL